MEVVFDASELQALGRAINRLPGEIKAKAMGRAMRRMRDMAKTRVVKRSAERTDLPQRKVRELTTAYFNAGGNTIEIIEKSGWIPLAVLGATQTKSGVRVRLRGSYKSAFLAKMASGHRGVMKRTGKARLPIRELYGPNPAHDITNNPDVFLKVLAEIIEDSLAPRVLHEIDRLLPR
ncbi:phage tail protein [Agrobacterium rosae]|uniref:phage tail protein n=1 Tax=Agrobacterium rosae TaxID=1972867 RepID=UPI00122F49F9|nr:phage tail protein [Agrobacterium rosae]KAA3510113.1 hypothetical protein DXM21_19990 [Agrobacterium rosae]KAA3514942.1 hypothetical protein DXM25_20380 [Agrobacterium rosae]MQB50734.1 hypothetical protein [Agrobacterium rosae]